MVKIITPYYDPREIEKHKQIFWEYDIHYEQDTAGIGSDLMFQQIWNKYPKEDIFILHADMDIYSSDWLEKVLYYVEKFPEAGMLGCLLLYPAKDLEGNHYIQSAGGKFTNSNPDHYGSGLVMENMQTFKPLEVDKGQYDNVREVSWTTFGGCYLRRSFINSVGGFSPEYEWTYNRDVDFCLTARKAGQKIYQIPVRLLHHESFINKRIKAQDPSKSAAEARNLQKLKNKWSNTEWFDNINTVIEEIND